MIAYFSSEDADTYIRTAKHVGELPTGIRIVIIALIANEKEIEIMEKTINSYKQYTR